MEIYDDYSVLKENEYTHIVFDDDRVTEYDSEHEETSSIPEEEDQWTVDNFENIRNIHEEIIHWSGFFQKLTLDEFASYMYYTNVENRNSKDRYDWYSPQEHISFRKCDTIKKFVSTHWKPLVDYHDYLERNYDYLFGSNELFMELAFNCSYLYT